jgi:hypothetical protein
MSPFGSSRCLLLGLIQPTFEPLRDPPDIAGRIAYAALTVAVGLILDLPEQFATCPLVGADPIATQTDRPSVLLM